MSDDDKITNIADRRMVKDAKFFPMTMPIKDQPKGPFTVTIFDSDRRPMFEVTFPDHTGVLPPNDACLGTAGAADLAVNLLSGALKVFAGAS